MKRLERNFELGMVFFPWSVESVGSHTCGLCVTSHTELVEDGFLGNRAGSLGTTETVLSGTHMKQEGDRERGEGRC